MLRLRGLSKAVIVALFLQLWILPSPSFASNSVTGLNQTFVGPWSPELGAINISPDSAYVQVILQTSSPASTAYAYDWDDQSPGPDELGNLNNSGFHLITLPNAEINYRVSDELVMISGLASAVNTALDNLTFMTLQLGGFTLKISVTFQDGQVISGIHYYFDNDINNFTTFATGYGGKFPIAAGTRSRLAPIQLDGVSSQSASVEIRLPMGSTSGDYGSLDYDHVLGAAALVDQSPNTFLQYNAWIATGTVASVNKTLATLAFLAPVSMRAYPNSNLTIYATVNGTTKSFQQIPYLVTPGQCAAGTTAPTGDNSQFECMPVPSGFHANFAGATRATPARPGHFAANAVEAPCAAGTYSDTFGASSCAPAPQGTFVGGSGWTAFAECPAGYFASGTGNSSCTPARAGKFVANASSATDTPCLAGTYQPNTGSSACISASAGYFVGSTSSTTQTACASGYTSNAGASVCTAIPSSGSSSSSSSSSVVETPAATVDNTCHTSVGGKATLSCLLNAIGKTAPAGYKASISVAKSSSKICTKSGTSVKGKKAGTCNVIITFKPKKGASIKYSSSAVVG